ncbi:L-fucose:H+ symporter permease [Frateuria aurantia]|uniref:L-fucose:H+ symporter permease n=1 Tax=Frateuria aurantia (strain ATCC 33424 / DSM 6220 / KCTC 2777 / LMG 1558 / NBRC 3245 / NCIMB 13370) TaxID=767434 RepID=H8KZ43_FRAAD|nr:L-fucose:H+ symporter permease [Frateuria aurantia]AFC84534.1 L-fucose:H+ symporter permease [Frateuria aurantia DSM 6220]
MRTQSPVVQLSDGFYLNRTPLFAFGLLCCLFSLWGCAMSLNDVLIGQFRKAFMLSDFQSALVQFSFYISYLVLAIPAAMVIKRFSYKSSILTGLLLYVVGCLLFFPAAMLARYQLFFVALFVVAAGLVFIETAADTYCTLLGPPGKGTHRLNLASAFQPIGAILGSSMGSWLIFKQGDLSLEQLREMPASQAWQHQLAMIHATLEPYRYLLAVLAVVIIAIGLTRYPACKGPDPSRAQRMDTLGALGRLFRQPRFVFGVLTQFLYVGAQVGVWSFVIRLTMGLGHLGERQASMYLIASFVAFFVGKLIANAFMRHARPAQVLFVYALLCIAALAYAVTVHNFSAVYAAILVSGLLGPCWPTIYGLTVDGLGHDRAYGGSVLVMSISGGGIVPLLQGYVSDASGGNMQLAYSVPLACFVVIAGFAAYCRRSPELARGEFADQPQ